MKSKGLSLVLALLAVSVPLLGADGSSPISLKIALVGYREGRLRNTGIRVRVTLTNVTQQQITVAAGGAEQLYKIELRDSSGKPVPKRQYYRFGSIAAENVAAGGTQTSDLVLSHIFELNRPGMYVVVVSRQSRHEPGLGTENAKSNLLVLNIQPKDGATRSAP
jgi:hypothetical protein